jgi:hypothetical protein
VPLATLTNLTIPLPESTTCMVHYTVVSMRPLNQGISIDEHVLGVAIVGVTDDWSASVGASAVQVK